MTSRFKELLKKYGKVAVGVHFSVSAVSITGLYVAIKNNVDVESLFDKFHLSGIISSKEQDDSQSSPSDLPSPSDGFVSEERMNDAYGGDRKVDAVKQRNKTAELVASTGGALALAVLCNKALFPVRVPITIVLTPPVARALARRKIIKDSMR